MRNVTLKRVWQILLVILITNVLCFSFLPIKTVQAAPDGWTSIGPEGGDFWEIAQNPLDLDMFFAYVTNGLFKSVDGGHNWTEISLPACASAEPNYVKMKIGGGPEGRLLLYYCRNLYITPIDVIDWTLILESFIPSLYFGDPFHISRNDPLKLAVLTDLDMKTSSDGGQTWQTRFGKTDSLTMKVDEPNKLLLAKSRELYYSENFGLSWTLMSDFGDVGGFLSHLTFSLNDQAIYLIDTNTRALIKSEDLGASWTTIKSNLSSSSSLFISEFNPDWILIDNIASSDGGSTWYVVEDFLESPVKWRVRKMGFGETFFLYGGTTQSFVRMNSDGSPIFTSAQGVNKLSIGTIQINPHDPDQIYACTRAYDADGKRCFFTLNGGESWRVLDFPVETILVSPLNFATVYIFGIESQNQRIRKSIDYGLTFTQTGTNPTSYGFNNVVHDPQLDGVLYANNILGFYRSEDSGASWTRLQTSFRGTIFADPYRAETLFNVDGPVFVSTDGGESWAEKTSPDGDGSSLISFTTMRDGDKTILYMALGNGTWISRDDATSWEQKSSYFFTEFTYAGSLFKTELNIPVVVGSRMYQSNGRIAYSLNYGNTWISAPNVDENNLALGVGVAIPGGFRIFAGTHNYSILTYDVALNLNNKIYLPMITR